MTTLVSDPVRAAAYGIVHDCGYRSAVLSGVQPDPRHLDRGGFHCSIVDLLAHGHEDDYSNVRVNDRGFNPKYGAAIDVSFNKPDMILVYGRVHMVWADLSDPRRRFFNAINCWKGSGDATRLDFDKHTAGYASPDHEWHAHNELHRRYLLDARAGRALISVYAGEPKAAWIAREEPAPPKPAEVRMLDIVGQLPELKRGMKDPVNGWNMITRLQRMLGITVDGDYGPATAAAVAKLNADQLGRRADGATVDAEVWKRLYGITAQQPA